MLLIWPCVVAVDHARAGCGEAEPRAGGAVHGAVRHGAARPPVRAARLEDHRQQHAQDAQGDSAHNVFHPPRMPCEHLSRQENCTSCKIHHFVEHFKM